LQVDSVQKIVGNAKFLDNYTDWQVIIEIVQKKYPSNGNHVALDQEGGLI